jgi:DNA-binding transcriptional LysR family regulator
MNIRVFKTFCDVVETTSFSRAAQTNGISQSAVSQQLAALERELGTQLLSRGGGFVAPTEAGKVFYRGAQDILRRHEAMIGEIRSARDAVHGVLRVGTIYSVGFYLLDPYIREFLRAYPEVELHVEYSRWNRITAAVLSGEMDVGVVAFPERHRGIESISLADEELVLACSPEHRLARYKRVDLARIEGENFIAFEANIPTRRGIDRLLKASRVRVNITMEFDNIETIKRAVEVAAGVSILPRKNIENEVADGHLAFAGIRGDGKWVRPIGILRRRGKVSTPAERLFLALLRSPRGERDAKQKS